MLVCVFVSGLYICLMVLMNGDYSQCSEGYMVTAGVQGTRSVMSILKAILETSKRGLQEN